MLLKEGEEIIFKESGAFARKGDPDWTSGTYIQTNMRSVFEITRRGIFGINKGTEIIWSVGNDDIEDVTTYSKTVLSKPIIRIIYKDTRVSLRFYGIKARNGVPKIKNAIMESEKSLKDKEYEKELELRKAMAGNVTVNIGKDSESRKELKKKGKNKMSMEIPSECFACSEEINPDEIEWVAPGKIECPECGAKIKVKKIRKKEIEVDWED
jgi:DNA-directed RNA polymerase subunit RPC12/RpoP